MPAVPARNIRATIRAAAELARLGLVLEARGAGRRRRSLRQVAAILNEAGMPGPGGGQWWPEGVRRALAAAERARARLLESSPSATALPPTRGGRSTATKAQP